MNEQTFSDWKRTQLEGSGYSIVRMVADSRSSHRPLLVIVPGFLADAPVRKFGPFAQPAKRSGVYAATEWELVATELHERLDCDVWLFSWPNGLIPPPTSEEHQLGRGAQPYANVAKVGIVPVVTRVPEALKLALALIGGTLGASYAMAQYLKWRAALKNADRAHLELVPYLKTEIARRPQVLLVGHSLGGRIALRAADVMRTSQRDPSLPPLLSTVAMAPALGCMRVPPEIQRSRVAVADIAWSEHDWVLSKVFRAVAMSEGVALGCRPEQAMAQALAFHDVSEIETGRFTGHGDYSSDMYRYITATTVGQRFAR